MTRIHALGASLAWALLVAGTPAFARDAGAFPDPGQTDATLRADRFGLFIGINDYTDPKFWDLQGCVRDATELHQFFRHQYDFHRSLVLLDGQATWSGIQAGFAALIEQVRRARRGDASRTIHVIIAYAGHGSIVGEASNGDDADYADSTWVPHDGEHASKLRRETHIIDDWIGEQLDALLALQATVLLISDSCHSGTISRADEQEDLPRGSGDTPSGSKGALNVIAAPRNGLIVFSAARDTERAWEVTYRGEKRGRFSVALLKTLTRLTKRGKFTYGELEKRVANEFKRLYSKKKDKQTPRFLVAGTYRAQPFLEPAVSTVERGSIVEADRSGREVVINLGMVHGSFPGARVEFHQSIEAARRGDARIASGEVVEASAVTSRVKLDARTALRQSTAVARLVSLPQMQEFLVHAEPGLPAGVGNHLSQWAKEGRISLATPAQRVESDLCIRFDRAAHALVLSGAGGESSKPKGPSIPLEDPEGAIRALDASLNFFGRLNRLMALQSPEDLLEVQLLDKKGQPTEAIRVGDEYRIRITNRSPYPLHVYLFSTSRPEDGPDREPMLPYVLFPDLESGTHAPALRPRTTLRALEAVTWKAGKQTDLPGREELHFLAVGQVAKEETGYAWVHDNPWSRTTRSGAGEKGPPSDYFTVGRLYVTVEPASNSATSGSK